MSLYLKPLDEQVLVITGATSGIGLTTARMAADYGIRGLVLVARSEQALDELAAEINSMHTPTRAISIAGDVADRSTHQRAATAAVQHFGCLDTWVNNAGVSIYGRLTDVTEEDHRRMFETNFWGLVHGSLVAVDYLKQSGGALINLGSVASERAIPIQGMYSTTKHAVKGFTDALRMELEADDHPISVTLIKPTSINTPFTFNARNYMDDFPSLPPPVYAPDTVAEGILYAAENPIRDLVIGGAGKGFILSEKLAPRMTDRFMENVTINQMHSGHPRSNTDALYAPSNRLRQNGIYDGMVRKRSNYTEAATHPMMTAAAVVAVSALAFLGKAALKTRR